MSEAVPVMVAGGTAVNCNTPVAGRLPGQLVVSRSWWRYRDRTHSDLHPKY